MLQRDKRVLFEEHEFAYGVFQTPWQPITIYISIELGTKSNFKRDINHTNLRFTKLYMDWINFDLNPNISLNLNTEHSCIKLYEEDGKGK